MSKNISNFQNQAPYTQLWSVVELIFEERLSCETESLPRLLTLSDGF
jgi:hypothetical protein